MTDAAAIGFVGCPRGRLLRVRMADAKRQRLRVECPDCHALHETDRPMARALRGGDHIDAEEIKLPDCVEASSEAEQLNRRPAAVDRQASDAAIIDALTTEPVRASKLADKIDFTRPRQLVRRARSMNLRAEKAGNPAPIAIGGGGRQGAPVTLARPE